MTRTDPDLWARIESTPLDFAETLARDEGWSEADATRVIAEYRRFLYLAQILDAPAAPGAPIDAAWRAHLLHTRAYWGAFVPEALGGQPFHRAAATVADRASRRAFHRAVRKAYRREFGDLLPRDAWPGPNRLDWGGLVFVMIVSGVLLGFLSFGAMTAIGWSTGVEVGGAVDTPLEKAGTVVFGTGWLMAMGSPLWAWLITKAQTRLPSRKRTGRWQTTTSISISVGRDTC